MCTATQCKNKIKNLTDDYKKVKDGKKKSGNIRQSFIYYDEMDKVLGTWDSTQPKNVIETGSPASDTPDHEENRNNEDDDHNDNTTSKSESDSKPKDQSVRDVERKRLKKRAAPSDNIDVMIKYMEESEKREDFFLRLAEIDREREERQQEKSMKKIAEIAKILKN